jgi:hypothetical protein
MARRLLLLVRRLGDCTMLSRIHFARSVVIASLAIFLSGPALAGAGALPAPSINREVVIPARRPSAPQGVATTTSATGGGEAQRYASREASAKGLETFRGGDRGVYIGSGALIIVLLVVLILVLI